MKRNRKQITKRHIGRPFDYQGRDGIINGKIIEVKNRIATFEFAVQGKADTFTSRISVTDKNIVEIY